MSEKDKGEAFLSRWSRRKLDEAGPEPALSQPAPEEVAVDEPIGEDAEAIADLPGIEGLDKDSDFTVFMRDGVPDELRNLALRKLWLSDPVLANVDGLNDYDLDYNAIMQSGAEFMKRLADAGEKFTRPGADEIEETGDGEEDEIRDDAEPVATAEEADEEPAVAPDIAKRETDRPDDT